MTNLKRFGQSLVDSLFEKNRNTISTSKESPKPSAGFTVPELMVTTTITAILFLAFMGAMTNYFFIITKNNASIDMTVNSQSLLRTTVEAIRLGDGVRQSNTISDANAPPGGWNTSNTDFVIVIATPATSSSGDYIIDSETGGPYINEAVYYKDSTSLMKRTLANPGADGNTTVTSCPEALATANCPADSRLAEYVKSMVFTLYDHDGAVTDTTLLARSIKIDLSMERSTFGAALSLDNSIRVTLRNRF